MEKFSAVVFVKNKTSKSEDPREKMKQREEKIS
jgi:hypothetical protein